MGRGTDNKDGLGASPLATALAVLRTRANLRCLGLSALIACAGCGGPMPDQEPVAGLGAGSASIWTDPSTGCRYIQYHEYKGGSLSIRYRRDGTPDCPDAVPAALQRQLHQIDAQLNSAGSPQ